VTHLKTAQVIQVAEAVAQSVTVVKTVVVKLEEQGDQVSSL
jgi:hypothetical protein